MKKRPKLGHIFKMNAQIDALDMTDQKRHLRLLTVGQT